MKIKPREMALMLLPCVGLLAFGAAWKRPRGAEREPQLQARVVVEPPWHQGDAFVAVNASAESYPEPSRRLYINCRIEGMLNKRQRVFYATGGFDPYVCWSKTHYIRTKTHNAHLRQVFRMSYIPKGATNLKYHIEVVSLEGAFAEPQEVTRGELQQARQSPRLLAYASASAPMSVPTKVMGHTIGVH